MSLWIRRGGGGPGPISEDFGPSDGADAIRDGVGPRSVTLPSGGTDITAGNLTQAVVNAAGVGATLKIRTGDHRLTSTLSFLQGQTVYVEDGAKVKGSALVTDWTSDGAGRWYKTGQTQDFTASHTQVLGASSDVDNPVCADELEDYYLDGVPMIAVTSKSAVTIGSNKKWMDRGSDTVWVGVDPSAHTIERLTFFDHLVTTGGSDISIIGGVFEHGGYSCLQVYGDSGCVVQDVEARYGHLRSLHVTGEPGTWLTGIVVRHCYVHHGGKYNHNMLYLSDPVVEYCEFSHGNDLHFGARSQTTTWGPSDEGASKALHTSGMVWRYNHSHDSDGSEWWDTDNNDLTVQESVFEDSYQFGAFFEDNDTATFSHNLFRDCGKTHPTYGAYVYGHHQANLYISTSDNVTINNNLFQTTPLTTYAYEGDLKLSYQAGRGGLKNLWTHHNRFDRTRPLASGRGFVNTRDSEEDIRYQTSNNKYDYNEYHVLTGSSASTGTSFHWGGGGDTSWDAWQDGGSLPYAPASYYDPNGTWTADL